MRPDQYTDQQGVTAAQEYLPAVETIIEASSAFPPRTIPESSSSDEPDRLVARIPIRSSARTAGSSRRGAMAGRAHRTLGDRPQQADLVAEIDRESGNVVGTTAGVGGDERRRPRLRRIGGASQPIAGAAGRHPFLAADPLNDPDDVDMARLDGERRTTRSKPLRQLAQQRVLHRDDDRDPPGRSGISSPRAHPETRQVPGGSGDCARADDASTSVHEQHHPRKPSHVMFLSDAHVRQDFGADLGRRPVRHRGRKQRDLEHAVALAAEQVVGRPGCRRARSGG